MQDERQKLLSKIEDLENRLAESEQLIEAIQSGEVDAFAINMNDGAEVFTLQSGDYAYRVLIEEFGEGAVNITEDGLIVYTNTCFFELLHLSYEQVVGCKFIDFVHPDSKKKYHELYTNAFNGKSKGEINLFVKDKIIPVYISLTSLQPKLPTIGIIITDLTEKKRHEELVLKYQKDLETKNAELEQSNTDLASFAFIASHDLQEPLRKIQIFSNRLLENDFERFSETTKNYFKRITESSRQMQKLINALLDYSRLNTNGIVYETTSLNDILATVKNDLNELIQDNEAEVIFAGLPTLDVITIQFVQLFSNLIINGIKYRRKHVKPVIKIDASLEPIPKGFEKNDQLAGKKCWKIAVADNGIGFEKIYEEKIFELFQRLHGRTEYEGTGIGLAICKKIVQNHNGIIKATGQPGVGATFTMYLPVAMA